MKIQSEHAIQKQTSRPTIGLLVTWLRDGYENGYMLGVADAAAELDANLICFVGGELRWDAPQNVVFDLLGPEKFDGLIISGTLGHALSPEKLQAFCARFAPLPLVGGALSVPGMVQVLPDSGSGMRDAVTHLVEVHGYRRIAFIQGPEGQAEASDRFQAYVDVLARHDIPLDPALIAAGDYRRVTGRAAMETLLARGAAFDAVVCANDDMAVGAFEVLSAHGLRVPEDVALVGFDDVEAAQHLETPLTTVRQSFVAAARAALETVLAMIRGAEVADVVYIPTELVVRRSCGCQLDAVSRALAPLSPALASPVAWETLPPPTNVPATLWQAFLEALQTGAEAPFLSVCDLALRQIQPEAQSLTASHLAEIAAWEALLSDMRRAIVPHLTERATLLHAENLLQQGRVLVNAALQRLEGYRRLLLNRQETYVQEFDRAMAAALTLAELQAPVERDFPALGIGHCYLALYDAQSASREQARLRFSYERDHGARLWDGGVQFPSRELLPQGAALEQRRYTAVLTSLVMRDTRLGFMLFEFGAREGAIYDRLGEQFSGSLLRMLLLKEQAEAQAALDESRRRAETALRDLMALQQRYVREVWENYASVISGYAYTAGQGTAPAATAWLPVMGEAVAAAQPVQQPGASTGYSLGLPLTLYGELIGVLGVERADGGPWSAEHIAMAQGLLEQTARALETQRLVMESQRRAAQLQTATEVAQITSSILTLEALLDQSVNLLRDRFGYYYVGLFLVEETGRWAVLRAGTGDAGRIMLERGHRLEIGGVSMIGRCVAQNQARIALDVGAEAVRFENPVLPDTHSELALPLQSRGRAIGAMTIQSVERAAFSEEDIAVLQTVADQLGNAIENVRLFDEMEQTVRALEAAQGAYTQESWRAFLDMMGQRLGYRYRLGLEPLTAISPEAQAALEQQRRIVAHYAAEAADVAGQAAEAQRAAVAVPVRLREQTIGALNVRFDEAHVPPETLALIEQVAEQLALSLESARLYQATQQRAAQERLISEVTGRMRESLDLERILQTAVRELGRVSGAARVDVQLGTDED